jgi:catechol 2,3-dioxygenase-like lactoylglutathione lyase family enzyme
MESTAMKPNNPYPMHPYQGGGWQPDPAQRAKAHEQPDPSDDIGDRVVVPEGAFVERLSHLVLPVGDLDRAERWYHEVFGLDVLGRNLTNEQRQHAVLGTNQGHLLILVETDSVVPQRPGTSAIHHAFHVTPNQYRRAQQRLIELGYDIVNIRAELMAHGEYSINIVDPDGNRVEYTCTGPEAWDILKPGVGVVDCGPAQKYRVGDVKTFGAGNFHLVRLKEGFMALSRWCTHMNGKTVYQKEHWRIYCPFHDATYNRCGEPTSGPAEMPLRLNPVRFSAEGHVLVDTDEVIDRASFDASQAAAWEPDVAGTRR